jgi:hypothetical protein
MVQLSTSVIAVIMFTGSAPQTDLPPALRTAAECMLGVLKETPGVRNAKLGVSNDEGWTHPYLEYEPDEKARWVKPTRFDLFKPRDIDRGPYEFQATVSGLVVSNEPGPDLHVTSSVVKEWKVRCGVNAYVLTD